MLAPIEESTMSDPRAVQSMFARIAGRYDLLNHTLSLGIDQRWRARAVRSAGVVRGELVVDVCTGTGDLALAFERAGARVIGVDFTTEMVRLAADKAPASARCQFVRGDALHLPLAGGKASIASIAFGLRNVSDRARALAEMQRVLKPGGKILVLEFSRPKGRFLGAVYRRYFTRVLPAVGRLVSGDGDAYTYLPRTVMAWLEPEELCAELARAGFVDCGWQPLTGGIACLHWGYVKARS